MKKLILIISMLFIITSCSSIENKKIENDQIIFENNIKCNNFLNRNSNNVFIRYDYGSFMKYSTNLNTCVWIYNDSYQNFDKYYIENIFTWETLFKCEEEKDENCEQNALSKFKNY